MTEPKKNTPLLTLRLLLAWTVVGVPLLWGVAETVKKSLLLFQ